MANKQPGAQDAPTEQSPTPRPWREELTPAEQQLVKGYSNTTSPEYVNIQLSLYPPLIRHLVKLLDERS